MARLVYYVAQSIDGFIAEPDGGVAFLDMFETHDTDDHGYGAFYGGIDSLVMGRKTYESILGFGGEWPYAGKPSWIMSSQDLETNRDDVFLTKEGPRAALGAIRAAGHSQTWLVGGGALTAAFENEGLITQWIISVVPYLLGAGIPLVADTVKPTKLALTGHTVFPSGLVQLEFE